MCTICLLRESASLSISSSTVKKSRHYYNVRVLGIADVCGKNGTI